MDPEACLREILDLQVSGDDYERLSELVASFEGWIDGGGFEPPGWRPIVQIGRAYLLAEDHSRLESRLEFFLKETIPNDLADWLLEKLIREEAS